MNITITNLQINLNMVKSAIIITVYIMVGIVIVMDSMGMR